MPTVLLTCVLCLLAVVIVLQLLTMRRRVGIDLTPVQQAFAGVEKACEKTERAVREEVAKNREEATAAARHSRAELGGTLKAVGDTLNKQLAAVARSGDQKLESMRGTVEQRLQAMQEEGGRKLEAVRQDSLASAKSQREEIALTLTGFSEALVASVGEMGKLQKGQLDVFSQRLDALTQSNEQKLTAMRETLEQRLGVMDEASGRRLDQIRQESVGAADKAREEVTASLKQFAQFLQQTLTDIGSNQRTQLGNVVEQLGRLTEATEKKLDAQRTAVDERLRHIQTDSAATSKLMREEVVAALTAFSAALNGELGKLTDKSEQKLDALKQVVEERLKGLQEDNSKRLEQMRQTVDEKLQGTLDQRLGESFKQVSDRLEQVHKGLGEMQALATGVGDLKKVLTNVKTRGTWGEVQLGAMLEQVLHPEQYDSNVATKDDSERVEFAIKLPGRGEDEDGVVWLPIDAKFPVEDYQRLVEAQERADGEAAEAASKLLEVRIKGCAKDICTKYLSPPKTTDFAILYLPTEGLFAEVVRRNGLAEHVQRECRVVIAGPTTLWSILNSLQMGFKTLVIQQRSSEVWTTLAAVKTEWTKYGAILEKVQKKLGEASNTLEQAQTRTRVIGRKLKDVQELPQEQTNTLLQLEETSDAGELAVAAIDGGDDDA